MVVADDAYLNRPTRAEISIPRLLHNFAIVKELVGKNVKIMPMVKANAYGHGIVRISKELIATGAHSLGVAYLEEALFLRAHGISAPIAVLGAINTEQIPEFIAHDIEITSSSIDKSRAISTCAVAVGKTAKVHLKIDTGMERIGVHWYNAERFICESAEMPGIKIIGIFSHFAKAETDPHFTNEQIRRFEHALAFATKHGIFPPYIHIANSAGIINFPHSHFTMVRPGIMLYGYDPRAKDARTPLAGKHLLPVMSLKTKVSFFKVVPAGCGISYNHTYITKQQTRIVTLPIGYGDGYPRSLSNKAEVLIRGKRYPVVGTICMDQTMIDIGPNGTAYNGDDVLLFGEMDSKKIPLEELCEKAHTITYEILTHISSRVPRIYTNTL
ncbi:MAG: alanine racemase [Spirochaetes bacterium]|nr:alanine racemase [Spirochaetota bacterium]